MHWRTGMLAIAAGIVLGLCPYFGACGGPPEQTIAGTWRSWIATAAALETPTTAGCGGLSTEGTLTFETPKGGTVAGRWDLCAGQVNFDFRGEFLPDGLTLGVSTSNGLLSALPRSADPARMTFELRGLGFAGEHLLVIERTVVRRGKIEREQ